MLGVIIVLIVVVIIIVKVAKHIKEKQKWQLSDKANQGDAQAQFELGMIYKNGKFDDIGEAVYWLQKASDQGVNDAHSELDICQKKMDAWFSGFNNYTTIKQCCYELAKNGFDIAAFRIKKDISCASVMIFLSTDVIGMRYRGTINFGSYDHSSRNKNCYCVVPYNNLNDVLRISYLQKDGDGEWNYSGEKSYGFHLIQLERPSILITSNVRSSENVPEWMMICAQVLEPCFDICYPSWVEQYQEAKSYVNVAFRNLGLL